MKIKDSVARSILAVLLLRSRQARKDLVEATETCSQWEDKTYLAIVTARYGEARNAIQTARDVYNSKT